MRLRCAQGNVFIGAQGIELVIEQKIGQLPRNYRYASFDKECNLSKDFVDKHKVPGVSVHSDGGFNRDLGYFEGDWDDDGDFFIRLGCSEINWYECNTFLSFGDVIEPRES